MHLVFAEHIETFVVDAFISKPDNYGVLWDTWVCRTLEKVNWNRKVLLRKINRSCMVDEVGSLGEILKVAADGCPQEAPVTPSEEGTKTQRIRLPKNKHR